MKDFLTDEEMEQLSPEATEPADFISDADMERLAPRPQPRMAATEAALRGGIQGLSFGLADEAVGAAEGLWDTLRGDGQSLVENYRRARDESRANFERAREDHPVLYTGGEVAGSIGSAFIPGLGWSNAAKGATTAARLGRAALAGGLAGAGQSEADLTKGEMGDLAVDTAVGAGLGAAMQGGLDKLARPAQRTGQALSDAGDTLKSLAERRAFKAAVGNQQNVYDQAVRQGRVNEIGRNLLDDEVVQLGDVFNPLKTPARAISERAADKTDEAWTGIEALFREIDEVAPNSVSAKDIAQRMVDYAAEIEPINESLADTLVRRAMQLERQGSMSLQEAQRLKNLYRFDPSDPQRLPISKEAINKINLIIGDEMEKGVQRSMSSAGQIAEAVPDSQFGRVLRTGSGTVVDPAPNPAVLREAEEVVEGAVDPAQRLKIYQDLKGKYGSFATTERAAEKLANRQEKNQTIGLTGKILAAGQIAADPSRWPQAALTALGNKAVQERGSALAAIGADKLADVLKATPETFGRFAPILQHAAQRGSHSLAVTHYLLTENEPEYREMVLPTP